MDAAEVCGVVAILKPHDSLQSGTPLALELGHPSSTELIGIPEPSYSIDQAQLCRLYDPPCQTHQMDRLPAES